MRIISLAFILCFCYSCSNNSSVAEAPNGFQLRDSLFALKDIQNSLVVDKFWYDRNDRLCTDSISKIPFIQLDSAQKAEWIAPVIAASEPKVDSKFLNVVFVSIQKKIGELTPIIVSVKGDDYESLIYLLLDNTGKSISHFIMHGGFDGGPMEGPDETLELSPVKHSFLKGNEISWYTRTEFMRPDSVQHPSIFDSVNYISKILPSGKIETKRLDSVRFERMGDWE